MGAPMTPWMRGALAAIREVPPAPPAKHGHAETGGQDCHDDGSGTCAGCGVALVTCTECGGTGYHFRWCDVEPEA